MSTANTTAGPSADTESMRSSSPDREQLDDSKKKKKKGSVFGGLFKRKQKPRKDAPEGKEEQSVPASPPVAVGGSGGKAGDKVSEKSRRRRSSAEADLRSADAKATGNAGASSGSSKPGSPSSRVHDGKRHSPIPDDKKERKSRRPKPRSSDTFDGRKGGQDGTDDKDGKSSRKHRRSPSPSNKSQADGKGSSGAGAAPADDKVDPKDPDFLAFSLFDEDLSGEIDVGELGKLVETAGATVSQSKLDELMETYDIDANGRLSLPEFKKLMSALRLGSETLDSGDKKHKHSQEKHGHDQHGHEKQGHEHKRKRKKSKDHHKRRHKHSGDSAQRPPDKASGGDKAEAAEASGAGTADADAADASGQGDRAAAGTAANARHFEAQKDAVSTADASGANSAPADAATAVDATPNVAADGAGTTAAGAATKSSGEAQALQDWIKENRLAKYKEELSSCGKPLDELAMMEQTELVELLKSVGVSSPGGRHRILTALGKRQQKLKAEQSKVAKMADLVATIGKGSEGAKKAGLQSVAAEKEPGVAAVENTLAVSPPTADGAVASTTPSHAAPAGAPVDNKDAAEADPGTSTTVDDAADGAANDTPPKMRARRKKSKVAAEADPASPEAAPAALPTQEVVSPVEAKKRPTRKKTKKSAATVAAAQDGSSGQNGFPVPPALKRRSVRVFKAFDVLSAADGKQRKKSLAAVDHFELMKQLEKTEFDDLDDGETQLLPAAQRTAFSSADEGRFSLAGHLARKEHAKRDKQATSSTDAVDIDDLPNYALKFYMTCLMGVLMGDTFDTRARNYIENQREARKITDAQHTTVLGQLGWTVAQYEAGCKGDGPDMALSSDDDAAAANAPAPRVAGDEYASLSTWLQEHKLAKHFSVIRDSEMSLEGLLDMDEDELKGFLVEIEIPAGARKRIIMAAKHTAHAKKGETALFEWLSENNLTKYQDAIKKTEITLDELIEMEATDLKDFLVEAGLPVGIRQRFIKAVKNTAVKRESSAPSGGALQALDDLAAGATTRGIFLCYAADDPTGKFPEKVGLFLHEKGGIEDYGLQIVEPDSGKTICFWTWPMLISAQHKLQSDDPDDMELLHVDVKDMGMFSFEANSCLDFHRQLQGRLELHPHASASAPTPARGSGSPQRQQRAPAPFKDLGVYNVTLGDGPLGLSIEQNKVGPDISAIIDGVSGASVKTGKMDVGHMLVAINGSCMTDFSFLEVLAELKQAERPIDLTFVTPPSKANPDLFDCETVEDPTTGMPDRVKLLIRGDHGLQIICATTTQTVAYFPWSMMPACHSELLSLDTNIGTIVFEAPRTQGFADQVQARIHDAMGARRLSRAAMRDGDSHLGGQAIIEVQLGEGPLGLSLEPNPFGPDQSAVVEELLPGGQAAMTGEIETGQYLLAINSVTTLSGKYQQTMANLRNAERPLLLKLINPIGRHELDEVHAANGKTVAFFIWRQIKQWKPDVGNDEESMEVFMLVIAGMGIFSFELNDAFTFADQLQIAMQDAAERNRHDDAMYDD
eukprot:g3333.t1